jgi:hypothetical protein
VRKVSEGVRRIKLRRDSSVVNTVGTDPGKVRTGRALKQKNLQGGESTVRVRRGNREIPLTLGS